jgi:hypothetical protein
VDKFSKRFLIWIVACLVAIITVIPTAVMYGTEPVSVTQTNVLLFWVLINQLFR